MVGADGAVAGVGTTALDAADTTDVPIAFVAFTVNVYDVPAVNPLTTVDVVKLPTVVDILPGVDVTVYPVIADPPKFVGGVHDTVADIIPAVAVPIVGAAGAVGAAGVTEFVGDEDSDIPAELVAFTVNV